MSVGELRSAKPSLLMRILVWVVSKRPSVFPKTLEEVAPFLDGRKLPPDAPMPDSFNSKFEVENWKAAGHDCVTLHPKTGKGARHILYFHGGGFVLPMFDVHWPLVAELVERTGASVTVPLYPVAPESTRQAQDAVADAAFGKLLEQWNASDIILSGDSAGGHMALALALRSIRNGGAKPGKLVLFAPWLDVTMADEAMRQVEPHDVMLKVDALREFGGIWAGDADPKGPECSPLYTSEAELSQLPPTRIYVGRHDLFVIDSRTFTEKLAAAGGDVQLFEYAGAPHVFMAILPTRESKDCLKLVSEFVRG